MGLVYLFSFVVGLGILLVQIVAGGKGDADAGDAHDASSGGGKDLAKDLSGKSLATTPAGTGASDILAFFLSLRFWVFTLLGFGMSGSLLHLFALAGPVVIFVLAAASGLSSGLFAQLAFRFVAQGSASTSADVTRAGGSIGRVLVPVGKDKVGKIRIVLKGQSVDILARSDGEEIARGDHVLVEDVEGDVARVSRRPSELA
ncbi:NfeD family protein [Polyangium jinanense]|uniref:NfeD family protein n=1 Tax=Polyangium jinanense TaxID=2829994 RepID=A0A9X3XB53_9BACT|nr:NfeD family protein [Polyangium jinanense]MDC3987429.1 NfeD family protein [Polyangium jinanense]